MKNSELEKLIEMVKSLPENRQKMLVRLLSKKCYTVFEAAELLGVHPETIRRAIRTGRLKAFRLAGNVKGSAFHISTEELERFIGGVDGGDEEG